LKGSPRYRSVPTTYAAESRNVVQALRALFGIEMAATTESWTFTCENPEGTVRTSQQVTIGRGQRQTFDLRGTCKARS
jgi:hypothetical protein